jgi:hypothetical protein
MRSRFLLLTILLLILFCDYAYAETKPRKLGLYFRSGVYTDSSSITDGDIEYAESTTGVTTETQLIPVALQLDEDLLNNWAYTSWFVSLEQIFVEDMPPALKGTTYQGLINTNKSNNGSKDFSIISEQTNIDEFTLRHPKYKSQIDALSEPSLSGDLNLWMLVFGKSLGVFIPIGERHRLISIGLGLGVGYTEGHYAVNLCDPYIVEGDPSGRGFNGRKFRKGICSNKSEIYSGRMNYFGLAYNFEFYIYSYIGETFELNFIKSVNLFSNPDVNLSETTLYPSPRSSYWEVGSIVYTF